MGKAAKDKVIPVWNVFHEDVNQKKIYEYNIFEHWKFMEDCVATFKRYKKDRNKIEEEIKRWLRYYFWCKCEHEIIITGFPNGKTERKVDIYTQILLNWDRFFEYIWDNQDEFF